MHGEIGIETSGGDREIGIGEQLAKSLELMTKMGREFARSLDIELALQGTLGRITENLGSESGT